MTHTRERCNACPGLLHIDQKFRRAQVGPFRFPRHGEPVAPTQQPIHPPGMNMDQRPRAREAEEGPHEFAKGSLPGKIMQAGEPLVEGHSGLPGSAGEASTQPSQKQGLGNGHPAFEDGPKSLPAIPGIDRSGGIAPADFLDQGLPHDGEQVHVLVAVDVVGRSAPGILEGIKLRTNFVPHRRGRQLAGQATTKHDAHSRKPPIRSQRRRPPEGGLIGQGEVQADVRGETCDGGLQQAHPSAPLWPGHHAARGREPARRDQVGNDLIDTRRETEVIGADNACSKLIFHAFCAPVECALLSPGTSILSIERDSVPPSFSVVIPLYNEAAGVALLHARLQAVLAQLPVSRREIVFVDDGSRDATFAAVTVLAADDPTIKGIRFARNFGKEAAMAAGLRAATGDVVVLMDGDLQHPPELIPQMLEAWHQGARMVTAVRRSRDTDPWLRRQLSRAFYATFAKVSEVALEAGGGDYRLFDRAVVNAINSLPERTRFMKGITSWVGFRQATVDFEPEERAAGTSAWSLWRLLRYAVDGLSAFSTLPLRVWSVIGLVMAAISGLYGSFLIVRTIILGRDVPGYASIMVAILFLSGIQLISLGVLGEYIGRIFTEVKGRPLFLVAERIGFSPAESEPS